MHEIRRIKRFSFRTYKSRWEKYKHEWPYKKERLTRIPFFYLGRVYMQYNLDRATAYLYCINKIHNDEPCAFWMLPGIRQYLYHPEYLRWFIKQCKWSNDIVLDKYIEKLLEDTAEIKSRPIDELIPPTPAELAADVLHYTHWLKIHEYTANNKFDNPKVYKLWNYFDLPQSYLRLAEKIYGYKAEEWPYKGIDYTSGYSYHLDRQWYYASNEKEAADIRSNVGKSIRRSAYARQQFGES